MPYGWVSEGTAGEAGDTSQTLIYGELNTDTGWDIKTMVWGQPNTAGFLLQTPAHEFDAALSPDGRWLAYTSDESGREEIYVQPMPAMDGKWQVSRNGGVWPIWAPDGEELFYREGPALGAVTVEETTTFSTGAPVELFRDTSFYPFGAMLVGGNSAGRNHALSPDGQRFLLNYDGRGAAETSGVEVVIVQNWFEELNARVPTGQ